MMICSKKIKPGSNRALMRSASGFASMANFILNKSVLFLLLSVLVLSGCRELVEVELLDQKPQLVVEAEITDTSGPHFVKLSLTQDYFSDEALPPADNAIVTIRDNKGQEETLIQTEPGLYVTQDLEGITGRTYTLSIEREGEKYESKGSLPEEAVIDSLEYRYFPASPPLLEEGYYVIAYGSLPENRNNFFRFKVFENDSLYNGRSDLFVQSDEFLGNTQSISLRFPYPFREGDKVRIEMYTISEEMYQYYIELITLLFNDGGLFSPPPQNPVSNIRNLTNPANPPLGYFQVASITKGSLLIEAD